MADVGPPEDRFCPTCGTEVDPEARFCPTCGAALQQDEELSMPPAPTWPSPEPGATPGVEAASEQGSAAPADSEPTDTAVATEPEPFAAEAEPAAAEEPAGAGEPAGPDEPVGAEPPAEPPPIAPPPAPPADGEPPAAPAAGLPQEPDKGPDLPFTWPTMLSGWLIGAGSAAGAIALIPSLGNAASLILFLALLGVAASVFLAGQIPKVPHLRLIVLCVTMVGLGIAFERAGFGARGISTILFLAMIAAAGGALLIELDRDRPVPPPDRPEA